MQFPPWRPKGGASILSAAHLSCVNVSMQAVHRRKQSLDISRAVKGDGVLPEDAQWTSAERLKVSACCCRIRSAYAFACRRGFLVLHNLGVRF